ncbi:MAG: IS200/IS605 family transposase [Candidatus Cloacimonadota bacterium]|nr:MAG: IS200/IS605 family transposase [Candidatus Cloacimonadota bacterium]
MSRFHRLSHTVWHCKYHLIWVPKYRYRFLTGKVALEVEDCIRSYCNQYKCDIIEINVQDDHDHVHLLVMIPPKLSVSKLMGIIKGKSAIRVFKRFSKLKVKLYWGNHFWARGYCVDTVGLDEEMIRKYVKFQEKKEKQQE